MVGSKIFLFFVFIVSLQYVKAECRNGKTCIWRCGNTIGNVMTVEVLELNHLSSQSIVSDLINLKPSKEEKFICESYFKELDKDWEFYSNEKDELMMVEIRKLNNNNITLHASLNYNQYCLQENHGKVDVFICKENAKFFDLKWSSFVLFVDDFDGIVNKLAFLLGDSKPAAYTILIIGGLLAFVLLVFIIIRIFICCGCCSCCKRKSEIV